jgi:5-methylcytosine-specific restriction endonuclease McrA
MPFKDKKAKRKYQLEWVKARRMAWINEHGPCKKCGSKESLEVDHIDPKLKTVDPAKLWALALDNPKRVNELKNCQVLCYDCHKEKTYIETAPTECRNGHKYTGNNTIIMKNGTRRCRTCRNETSQRNRDKKKIYR